MTDKKIESLRTFFRVSNLALDFVDSFVKITGGNVIDNKMKQLHKKGLEEIEKENPDLLVIDNLLLEMQLLAEENNKPKPNFPKGGIKYL